jgi:hypothetical protein
MRESIKFSLAGNKAHLVFSVYGLYTIQISPCKIRKMKELLNAKFPYSFGFELFPIKKGTRLDIDYDSVSARELADTLDIPYSRIVKICDRERFNLPFGLESILHRSVADKITELISYDEYQVDDIDGAIDVDIYGDTDIK